MVYLRITAIPIPRDENPITAPAADLAARLCPGEAPLAFLLCRHKGETCCYLGFDSVLRLQQAETILGSNGYLVRRESPPALGTTRHLLCRSVEQRPVVSPGATPRQMLLPAPITTGANGAAAIFQALSFLADGCGLVFFLRRAATLPLATVSHLHQLHPPEGSLSYTLLTERELYEAVGCVYGSEEALSFLASEALFTYAGLTLVTVPGTAIDSTLFSTVSAGTLQPALQPLKTVCTREELRCLADLSGAAKQDFPLNKDTLFGIPRPMPKRNEAMLRLGFSAAGVPMELPLKYLRQHLFIGGPPGSGKGNQLFSFIQQLHTQGIPMLVIESAKEELHHLRKVLPALQVWSPRKGEFSLNPFALEGDITWGEMRTALLATVRMSFKLDGPLEELFSDTLNRCFAKNGYTDDSSAISPNVTPFGLSEFMEEFTRLLQDKRYSERTKTDMQTAGLVRLNSLFNQNRAVFDSIHAIPAETLLSGENLIQLNCLTTVEAKQMFMSILFLRLCAYLRLRGTHCADRPVKLAILMDESHNLLQPATDSQGKEYSFATDFQNMLLELRSQGVAVILADQSSNNIPPEIVNSCATKIFFGAAASGGIGDVLPLAGADATALAHLYLLTPGEGCFYTCGMQTPAFFACPNLIDLFHMEVPYPRKNAYLQAHPRLTLETYRQCRLCPARGKCTQKDKTAASQVATTLYMEHGAKLSALMAAPRSDKTDHKISGVLTLVLSLINQKLTGAQRYCAVVQFVRDFNRENPGQLDLASILKNAGQVWQVLDANPI